MSVIVNDCQFCGRPKDLSITAANLCECESKRTAVKDDSTNWITCTTTKMPGNRKQRRAAKSGRKNKGEAYA